MRILAFADVHVSDWALDAIKRKIKQHQPDLAINVGDFSIFDEGTEQMLKRFDKLGLPILTIHGNHETDTIVEHFCKKSKHLVYMHEQAREIDGVTFLAWGGGGFSRKEQGFEQWVKTIDKLKKPAVFITHAPPADTQLDVVPHAGHVGCLSFTRFIKKHPEIVLAVSGHIHDTFYTAEKLEGATILNPGPTGTIIDIGPRGGVSYSFDKLKDLPAMY